MHADKKYNSGLLFGENVLSEDVTKACWHCSSLDPVALLGLGQFVGIRGTVTVLSVGVGTLRHQAQQ